MLNIACKIFGELALDHRDLSDRVSCHHCVGSPVGASLTLSGGFLFLCWDGSAARLSFNVNKSVFTLALYFLTYLNVLVSSWPLLISISFSKLSIKQTKNNWKKSINFIIRCFSTSYNCPNRPIGCTSTPKPSLGDQYFLAPCHKRVSSGWCRNITPIVRYTISLAWTCYWIWPRGSVSNLLLNYASFIG